MPPKYIVRGQKVRPESVLRAKELRRNMTPAERILWERLRRNALKGCHFRRQQVIAGFIADFYCHSAGLVIEVDGPIHDARNEYDADRDRIIAARGIKIIRIKNEEVINNLDSVLKKIEEACERDTKTT
jgi:very-short-patch-repair endonuclease